MQLVVITGMSGAGKAAAAKIFEDMAYTVVDNLPPVLLPELVEKCLGAGDQPPGNHLAVVIDARSGSFFAGWEPALKIVQERGVLPVTLFFDASDTALVQRFKETRRKHPLYDKHGGILSSLQLERSLLETVKDSADKVIDTTDLTLAQLRHLLTADFSAETDRNGGMTVTLLSFGFKHGLPLDADLVFDVRFLRNPHYVPALKPRDGRDPDVQAFVLADPDSAPFLARLEDLLQWSIPKYIEEGKSYLTVAIGCTGGRHRSVVLTEKLAAFLEGLGYRTLVQHRDIEKRR